MSGFANIDFATGENAIEISSSEIMDIVNTAVPITLLPPAVPSGTGVNLHLILIEFYQQINGELYILKNGAYNVLSIVEVV